MKILTSLMGLACALTSVYAHNNLGVLSSRGEDGLPRTHVLVESSDGEVQEAYRLQPTPPLSRLPVSGSFPHTYVAENFSVRLFFPSDWPAFVPVLTDPNAMRLFASGNPIPVPSIKNSFKLPIGILLDLDSHVPFTKDEIKEFKKRKDAGNPLDPRRLRRYLTAWTLIARTEAPRGAVLQRELSLQKVKAEHDLADARENLRKEATTSMAAQFLTQKIATLEEKITSLTDQQSELENSADGSLLVPQPLTGIAGRIDFQFACATGGMPGTFVSYFTDPLFGGKGLTSKAFKLLMSKNPSPEGWHATAHPDNPGSVGMLLSAGYTQIDPAHPALTPYLVQYQQTQERIPGAPTPLGFLATLHADNVKALEEGRPNLVRHFFFRDPTVEEVDGAEDHAFYSDPADVEKTRACYADLERLAEKTED